MKVGSRGVHDVCEVFRAHRGWTAQGIVDDNLDDFRPSVDMTVTTKTTLVSAVGISAMTGTY